MIEFYLQIKWVHVAAVLTSGGLFAAAWHRDVRGARWYMAAPLRYLSYTIDTVLLTAAMMLATLLHQYPFVNGWLTTKVLLLVVYVVFGSCAQAWRHAFPRVRGVSAPHSWCTASSSAWRVRTILVACSPCSGCSFLARMGPCEYALPRRAAVLYVYASEIFI